MPNPTLKSLMLSASLGLCACEIPPGSDVYHPYSPPRPIGEAYNPAIKIEADPARFPLGGTISVNASVYNKSNTGSAPSAPQPGLQLRVVAADANGDYPASGGPIIPARTGLSRSAARTGRIGRTAILRGSRRPLSTRATRWPWS